MPESKEDQQMDVFQAAHLLHKCVQQIPEGLRQRALSLVAANLNMSLEIQGQAQRASENTSDSSYGVNLPSSVDIKSFVENKAPQNDIQYVAVVAYYYRFEAPQRERRDAVDARTIQDSTRLVKRPRLTNPRSTLNNARVGGYLDRIAPGEYAINAVGENLVAMALPSDATSSSTSARKKKKSTKKSVNSSIPKRG